MAPQHQPDRVPAVHTPVGTAEQPLLDMLDGARDAVVRDLPGAFRELDRLEGVLPPTSSGRVRSRLHAVRAHALNYASRYAEAAEHAGEALRLAEAAGDEVEAARAWMALVHAHAKLGDLAEALRCARAAEAAFLSAGRSDLAVQALTNAAIVTRMAGDGAGAIAMFDRALGMREHEPPTRAQIESGRAEALLDIGRFAEAEAGFLRAAETFESVGITRAAAIVRGNLADLYGRQGRLASAIAQFEVARRFFEQDQATGELGRILTEQADVYASTGLAEDAIAAYRRAERLLASAGAAQERARALIGLGRLLVTRDPGQAHACLARAAELFAEAGNAAGTAAAGLMSARLSLAEGRTDDAERELAAVEPLTQDRASDALLCSIAAADIAIERGSSDRAEALLTLAAARAESLGLPILHAETLSRRAAARACAGRRDEAIADATAAIELIEGVRGTLRGSRFRAGLLGGQRSVYAQAVALLLDAGRTVEAFETTERARGRTMLELIGGGAELDIAASPGGDADDRLLRELAAARSELNAVYTGHDPTLGGPVHAAWLQRVRDAETRITGLETRLHASGRGREVLGVPEPFSSIAGHLAPGQALVSYWCDGGRLVAFIVHDGRAQAVDLAHADEVEQAVHDAQFQIRRGLMRSHGAGPNDRRIAACRSALAALHSLVWRPLDGALGDAREVVVIPAGPLHMLPFGALYDGQRYLVETVEPIVLPSASVLPLLTQSRNDAAHGVCVLAAPDRAAPEIQTEAELLRDTLVDARVLVGQNATADAARSMASDAGILHLACHGAFPPNNPLAAGLRLADRWITVRDVVSWRLPGSVVVLSGCDTGRSTLETGEELYGFARGFFAAGARGLVMSLWAAHDASTRGLMAEMYSALGPSAGPAGIRRALISSQRSRIRAGIHPAFWSNFVYMGV